MPAGSDRLGFAASSTGVHITLTPLTALTLTALDRIAVEIGDLTWPVANLPTGRLLLDRYLIHALGVSWAVHADGELAAVFALTPYGSGGARQTSTYIRPRYRRTPVNSTVKEAVVDAVARTGRTVVMSIDETNPDSLTMAARLLPGYEPSRVQDPNRVSIVYDLGAGAPRLNRRNEARPDIVDEVAAALERLPG